MEFAHECIGNEYLGGYAKVKNAFADLMLVKMLLINVAKATFG